MNRRVRHVSSKKKNAKMPKNTAWNLGMILKARAPTAVRTSAAKDDLLLELVQALGKMGSEKIQKDFNELVVEPFSDPDPKPIAGLLPSRELADDDSKFCTVTVGGEEVTLHYKEVVPPSPSPPTTMTTTTTTTTVDNDGGIDALLCLHGANGSEFSFRHLLPRVATSTGVRCIAFDRPPYGLSSRPTANVGGTSGSGGGGGGGNGNDNGGFNFVYTPEGQAELTLALMDALGVRRAALLGHSAGAPVALDAALAAPRRVPSLILVAPAVFVGDPPTDNDEDTGKRGRGGGGGLRLPLDRALRFAWFRFLISQDAPGLNVVRGVVNRQRTAIEEGRMYADLAPDVKEAYLRPTKAEGWDQGLLQLFRGGGFGGGDGGERLRAAMPALTTTQAGGTASSTAATIIIGSKDKTTPPALAAGLRDAMRDAGVDVRYEQMPAAAHLPMEEEAGGVREDFEAIVVDVVSEAAAAAAAAAPSSLAAPE